MTEQSWSLVIGFLVVVGFRLLDWAFPRGMVWKQIKKWSVKNTEIDDDRGNTRSPYEGPD